MAPTRSLFVAVASYRGLSVPTFQTLRKLMADVPHLVGMVGECPWVDLARAELVAMFLESGRDALLFLDDDIEVESEVIVRMIALDVPVVSAPYRKRTHPHDWAFSLFDPSYDGPWQKRGPEQLLEVKSAGLGCTLMQRQAIESLCALHPELESASFLSHRTLVHLFATLYEPDASGIKRAWPEDTAFFRRLKRADIPCLVLAYADVGHAGICSHLTAPLEPQPPHPQKLS